ncbi:MAG: hypothetical protein ACRCTK_02525 [Alphaproteobacteria bacterium]
MKQKNKIVVAMICAGSALSIMPGYAGQKLGFLAEVTAKGTDKQQKDVTSRFALGLKNFYEEQSNKMRFFREAIGLGLIRFKTSGKDLNLQTVLTKIASDSPDVMAKSLHGDQTLKVAMEVLDSQLQKLTWSHNFSHHAQQTIPLLDRKFGRYYSKADEIRLSLQKENPLFNSQATLPSKASHTKSPQVQLKLYQDLQEGLDLSFENNSILRVMDSLLESYRAENISTEPDLVKYTLDFFIKKLKQEAFRGQEDDLKNKFILAFTAKVQASMPAGLSSNLGGDAIKAITQVLTKELFEYLDERIQKWKGRLSGSVEAGK